MMPEGDKIYTMIWKDGGRRFYMSREQGDRWSVHEPLSERLNSYPNSAWRYTVSQKESICFSNDNTIMLSAFNGKEHLSPVAIQSVDNKPIKGVTPFIARDESYIIFSLGEGGNFKDNDLYIIYNLGQRGWSHPCKLGTEINNPDAIDLCPAVFPDDKYMFFMSRSPGKIWRVFWADASFIKENRPGVKD